MTIFMMTAARFFEPRLYSPIAVGILIPLLLSLSPVHAFDFGALDQAKEKLEKAQKDLKTKNQEVTQNVKQALSAPSSLSPEQIAEGLKEALTQGARNSTHFAAKTDAYLKDGRIRIPLPIELQKMEAPLRKLGLGTQLDSFVETLNHAAEKSASQATPIFVEAIKNMNITDATRILRGDEHAATSYLQEKTTTQLVQSYTPIVQESLGASNATRYYSQLVKAYNKIPMVKPLQSDLATYASEKAVVGLFVLIGDEEAKIRHDPKARATEVLQKVFAK